jgi:hypothetical protein
MSQTDTIIGIPAGTAPGDLWHDHVAHSVPDLAAASVRLEQLGFQLTPRSDQLSSASPGGPLVLTGMANRCVMLREGYLEITGTIADDTPTAIAFQSVLTRHVGLHLMALGTPDPEYQVARLQQAGFGPAMLVRTQRMIGTEAGEELGRFTIAVTPRDHLPEARVPLVRQETPGLVWQPRWLEHPNGAQALLEVVAVVPDIAEAASRYARFTGVVPTRRGRGITFALARGALTLLAVEEAQVFFSGLVPPPCLMAYVLSVTDIDATKAFLTNRGVSLQGHGSDCFSVDGGAALGGVLHFTGPGALPAWGR